MAKLTAWLRSHLPTQRRLIQLYAALLHNAHVKGFITGDIYTGPAKMLCVPGFNCYSCPGAIGACPLGALQNALAATGSRAPTYVLGILLLLGLTLGRTICGFLCPTGLLQDLLHKIPTPKIRKNRFTRALSWLKYVLLAVFVIILPLWYALQKYPLPAFCKYICPVGTLEGAVGLLANSVHADKFSMLGLLFTRKFIILVVILLACVFLHRAFCRFLCPLGALYGLFAKVAVIGVRVDHDRCTDCGRCVGCCPMDIRQVGDHECIQCGACIGECPTKAISIKAGKITLHGPEIEAAPPAARKRIRRNRRIAWAAGLVLLAGVLLAVNLPDVPPPAAPQPAHTADPIPPVPEEEAVPTGKEVGMVAPDFTVPLYGAEGGSFTLSGQRGKTVVVNFWATWCSPCVQELPHFDEVYRNREDVSVIAIHSDLITDDVEAYLSGFDYAMPFALDADGSVIQAYGGSLMLPQTVIIDTEGVITYNAVGSLTAEKLEALLGGETAAQPTPTAAPTAAPKLRLERPLPR